MGLARLMTDPDAIIAEGYKPTGSFDELFRQIVEGSTNTPNGS